MAAEAHRPTAAPLPAEAQEPGARPTRLDSQIAFGQSTDPMVIDCDRCTMRGIGCGDCVVTVLLGSPPYGVELNDDERDAIDVLATAGLVPPLKMAEAVESRQTDSP